MSGRHNYQIDLRDAGLAGPLAKEFMQLGRCSDPSEPPEKVISITEDGRLVLGVALYQQNAEAHAFVDAITWYDRVVIGWGERLYFVNPVSREVAEIALGSYFGYFYRFGEALYASSAERVMRLDADGSIVWISETLGLDGVLIHDLSEHLLHGEGEWDAPGGWRPFCLHAQTGVLIPQD